VTIPVVGRSFTGAWVRGQRDAQIEACGLVAQFLSEGGELPTTLSKGELPRTLSKGSSTEFHDDLRDSALGSETKEQ